MQIYIVTKYLVENAKKNISETLDFKISGGACPQTSLEARAFGTRFCEHLIKDGEIRDTKILHLSRNIVSLQVFVDVSRFSPCVINLSRNKNICCEVEKVAAKRARVYFEQLILASLLVFHQTHNLSGNKFARAQANQPIRAPHFFNPQRFCCGSN